LLGVLVPGDPNCPYGGNAYVANGQVSYVCNGAPGAQGPTGPVGPAGPQGAQGPSGLASFAALNGTLCTAFDGSSSSLVVTLTASGTYSVSCPGPVKLVFITSQGFTGNLGGLSGADTICQNLANNAHPPLNGVFKAWLSDTVQSPSTRFTHYNLPYVRVDGVPVATNWTALTQERTNTENILNPIIVDENGTSIGDAFVWTVTWRDGTPVLGPYNPVDYCNNWTAGSPYPLYGPAAWATTQPNRVYVWWTFVNTQTCDTVNRLYCFQQ
jgi:hypothetical protein